MNQTVTLTFSTTDRALFERTCKALNASADSDATDREVKLVSVETDEALGAAETIFLIHMALSILTGSSGIGAWCLAQRYRKASVPLASPEAKNIIATVTEPSLDSTDGASNARPNG